MEREVGTGHARQGEAWLRKTWDTEHDAANGNRSSADRHASLLAGGIANGEVGPIPTPVRSANESAVKVTNRRRCHAMTGSSLMVGAVMSATACSRPVASRAGEVSPVALPVAASSMRSVYGIQLELRGSASVHDRWVYVDIPAGAARTFQGRANAWDLVVRAGIATCAGRGGSRLVTEGRAARIAPLIGLTPDNAELDTVTRTITAPLRLDVGIPPGTDPERSWVTIEVVWPIESVIASYSLPATGGLVAGATAPADAAAGEPGRRTRAAPDPLDALGTRPPPGRMRCS
jgi:hypothetical protein